MEPNRLKPYGQNESSAPKSQIDWAAVVRYSVVIWLIVGVFSLLLSWAIGRDILTR